MPKSYKKYERRRAIGDKTDYNALVDQVQQDKRVWCECCIDGVLIDENAGVQAFDDSMSDGIEVDLFNDVFFLKYRGETIGTVTAFVREDGNGELHMVSIRPEYRGKGLSRYLNAVGKIRLKRAGVKYVYLTTDEFRRGAIRGYLSAGFLPVDNDADMMDRWETVLADLGIVKTDMVDVSDAEPETFGAGGFRDPAELLSWLEANRPCEEPVFSHGDLCLPNIFFRDGKLSCLIDLENAGVSDKWQDLALCLRSLIHNANGTYGKVYPRIHEEELFKLLGVEPDPEKLRYYILLDELF